MNFFLVSLKLEENIFLFYLSLPKFRSEVKTMFNIGKHSELNRYLSKANLMSRTYDIPVTNQSPRKQQLNELRNIMIFYPSYKTKVFKWNKSGLDEENRVTSNIKDDKSFGCSRFDVKWKFKESHRFR